MPYFCGSSENLPQIHSFVLFFLLDFNHVTDTVLVLNEGKVHLVFAHQLINFLV